MNKIAMDFDIYHRRRWPGRPMSLGSCAWLLMSSPGLRLLLMHRVDRWLHSNLQYNNWRSWSWRVMKIFLAPVKWISQINAKSQIGNDITIDGGVCFSDEGYIMFGAKKTGTGTIIGTRVTFGKSHNDYRCPKIGYNVWIGSDCVIYGNISIGDGATLLPNTVLSKSIPPNVVMQGNPARLVLQNFDNSELRDHHNIDAVQHVKNKRQMGNV